jgi:hypothetical protein
MDAFSLSIAYPIIILEIEEREKPLSFPYQKSQIDHSHYHLQPVQDLSLLNLVFQNGSINYFTFSPVKLCTFDN